MTRNEARQAIYNRVLNNSSLADGRIFLDGDGGDEPAIGIWIRVAVRNTTAPQQTLGRSGNRKFARNGNIFIQVFDDAGNGTSGSDAIIKELVDLFEGEEFDGIYIRNVEARETGPTGKWYMQLVECEFNYEIIK